MRYYYILKRLSKYLSIRAAAFSLFAVFIALVSVQLAPFVPDEWAAILGNEAVDQILKIVASSMLVVVTFSLATMVSSYTAASEGVTPRAARLLMEDHQSQNSLSIFLGAFIFSIVSIIAISTGYYGPKGRFILFIFTVLLIVLIVSTIIGWIEKLSRLGRVHETIIKIEETAAKALKKVRQNKYKNCIPSLGVVSNSIELKLQKAGYIQSINFSFLQELAVKENIKIAIEVEPGTYVSKNRIVAQIIGEKSFKLNADIQHRLEDGFEIGSIRDFDEDPRFGFITLSEVASRALSPAVNDPGTAIDVIGSMIRLFTILDDTQADDVEPIKFNRLYFKALDPCALFEDIVRPLSRDGAGHIEVVIRLYKALKAFETFSNQAIAKCALDFQKKLVDRANQALKFEDDRMLLAKEVQS